jgi:hypothetical protein
MARQAARYVKVVKKPLERLSQEKLRPSPWSRPPFWVLWRFEPGHNNTVNKLTKRWYQDDLAQHLIGSAWACVELRLNAGDRFDRGPIESQLRRAARL